MLDRLKTFGMLLAAAVVLVVIVKNAILATLVGWVLLVYVIWRAWPGLRSDYTRLRSWAYPQTAWRF